MNVLIFITFNCNNRCPYCWQIDDEELKKTKMHTGTEWYKALSANFDDDWMDFTGGEPTIIKDFFPMLGLLSKRNMVSMTTNLTFDPSKLEVVRKGKLNSLTCSFHPTQRMSNADFFGKVRIAKEYANNITINFVMYPPQMNKVDEYEGYADDIGVSFHKDPCSGHDYIEEEREFVDARIGKDRKVLPEGRVTCTAGSDHCVIYPNGAAMSCLRKAVSLGNIFGGFKKLTEPLTCDVKHECAGCDRDKVKMYDPEGNEVR
jgi:MoaA/NifB/PqqE/SkfB family radical SAM enzyme